MPTSLNTAQAELDHLFLFVKDEPTARSMMMNAGLRINYSRIHSGQGTRNLCACLDDVFLELLWLGGSPISKETEEITLAARGRGHGSPLGVSWRGSSCFEADPKETVPYLAPFLPAGVSIPVARASLKPELPFVFRTPGGTAPIDRTDGLVDDRQSPHLATLGPYTLSVPNSDEVASLLKPFNRLTVQQGQPRIQMTILRKDGTVGNRIDWPLE